MLNFQVTSDLYLAGYQEDGQPYTAEVYYIVAVDMLGNRLRHFMDFPGCAVHEDDEGFTRFIDIREDARQRAKNLMEKMQALQLINRDYWIDIRPEYGSIAYQQYGQFDDWMEEQSERV